MKNNKSKGNIIIVIVICLTLLTGIALLIYPVLGNIIISIEQTAVNNEYKQSVEQMDEEQKQEELRKAEEYNENLGSQVVEDPFAHNEEEPTQATGSGYYDALGFGEDAIMGTVEIPSINVDLPIYHGTTELVLQKGVGHLEGTSLPVGGINTHSVLTGHSALPNAKIFTDLEKMVLGDYFYISEYGETLVYKVSNIKTVEANDSSDLGIISGKDLVTLLTCTPYGINTHRLLVTGERDLVEEERLANEQEELDVISDENQPIEQAVSVVANDPMLMNSVWLVLGILLVIIIIIFVTIYKSRKNNMEKIE